MKDLLKDHMVWLVLALGMVLGTVLVESLTGHLVDDRLITGGFLVLIGAIANHARNS